MSPIQHYNCLFSTIMGLSVSANCLYGRACHTMPSHATIAVCTNGISLQSVAVHARRRLILVCIWYSIHHVTSFGTCVK